MEKEKGKGNCVGMLGNKKNFVSLTYVDHSDKIPDDTLSGESLLC